MGAERALPRLVLADGTAEALKWLGLALMIGDHAVGDPHSDARGRRPVFLAVFQEG